MTILHYRFGILVMLSLLILSPSQAGPLHDAVKKADHTEVKRLIAKGAKVNKKDKFGLTALMAASYKGHINIVKTLLSHGADINAKNKKGATALMAASGKGHINIVKTLLAHGAKVNVKINDGATALVVASRYGHNEIVKMLLANGADVNAKSTKEGWTVLMTASLHGHGDVVKLLLANGADVNAKTNKGWTVLMTASRNGQSEIVKMLLARGADVNAKSSNDRMTALYVASLCGHEEIVKVLRARGGKASGKLDGSGKGNVEICGISSTNTGVQPYWLLIGLKDVKAAGLMDQLTGTDVDYVLTKVGNNYRFELMPGGTSSLSFSGGGFYPTPEPGDVISIGGKRLTLGTWIFENSDSASDQLVVTYFRDTRVVYWRGRGSITNTTTRQKVLLPLQ